MLMQLVFGCNVISNTKFIADWDYIRQRKQNIVHNNNGEKTRSEFHTHIEFVIRLC